LVSVASTRAAFRVSLADGRQLKARRVESTQRCESLARIWPLLKGLPFAAGLARQNACLLEPWIVGHELSPDRATPAQLEEAGDMLGRLHRLAVPASLTPGRRAAPARLLRTVEQRLGTLADLGLLTPARAATLFEEAHRHSPPQLETGLIHHDFCAENLIVTDPGALWAIDNEDMRVGALDADLARCFLRWPMSIGDREAFLAGYRRHRPDERYQAHARFWSIWALAGAAEFRASRRLPADQLLTQLRR
jgi:Ser/Thr protein kinase RdoA (MazF antagonist)